MSTFDFRLNFYNSITEDVIVVYKSVEFDDVTDKVIFNHVADIPAGYQLISISKRGRIHTGSQYKVLKEGILTVQKEE